MPLHGDWRKRWDSNPRTGCLVAGLYDPDVGDASRLMAPGARPCGRLQSRSGRGHVDAESRQHPCWPHNENAGRSETIDGSTASMTLLPGSARPEARLLLGSRGLRAFGDGLVSLLLPVYLAMLG